MLQTFVDDALGVVWGRRAEGEGICRGEICIIYGVILVYGVVLVFALLLIMLCNTFPPRPFFPFPFRTFSLISSVSPLARFAYFIVWETSFGSPRLVIKSGDKGRIPSIKFVFVEEEFEDPHICSTNAC